MRGLGGVEPLARQGALLEQVLRAIVLEHRVGERRFGRLDRRLGDADGRRRGVDLRIDLAAIDRGEDLAGADPVADVDRNARQGAGQLRFHADAACGVSVPES